MALNIFYLMILLVAFNEVTIAVPVIAKVHSLNQVNKDMEYSILNQLIFSPVSREDWGARPPTSVTPLVTPVPYVVIHHTYIPGACNTTKKCSSAMRGMQRYHQDENKWADIGYNFCVGGDGQAYVGRGWKTLGAHALHFNTVSIGICLIGDWREKLPPSYQIDMTHDAISYGVQQGYIAQDYKLVGHRQVRDTECPGDALFEEIKNWPHFSAYPAGPKDLDYVLEQIEAKRVS